MRARAALYLPPPGILKRLQLTVTHRRDDRFLSMSPGSHDTKAEDVCITMLHTHTHGTFNTEYKTEVQVCEHVSFHVLQRLCLGLALNYLY